MKADHSPTDPRALVMILDDLETADEIARALQKQGFSADKIEFVTHSIHEDAPEVKTPRNHETTTTSMIDGATRWGAVGAGAGVLAGLLTPFPGAGLAMMFMGGVFGGAMGTIAGIEQATEDDTVNLPTLDEYEELVQAGENLLVLQGTHAEVMQAEAIVNRMYHVRSHIHHLHGHAFHEHPADLQRTAERRDS